MKRFTWVVVILMSLPVVATPQSPVVGQPNLDETISFMDGSVRPENTYIALEKNHCAIEIARNKHYTFVLPHGTHVKSVDAYGVKHYGFTYAVIQELPSSNFVWISLSSIDPDSIKSYGAFSGEYITREHPDENPSALKHPNLTVVDFGTRNQEKTIREGSSLSDNGTIVFNEKGSFSHGMLVFESQDRGERFVTAFVHAVNLCGGKTSDFAPTPRK